MIYTANYKEIEKIETKNGMEFLKKFFPLAEVNNLNFCLFSTSGTNGSYRTIEDYEKEFNEDTSIKDEQFITFLVIQPRIICMKYGNCQPKTYEDIEFLKKLRDTSQEIIQTIGFN